MGVTERTFVAVKPDGVQRCLVGEIIRRCERAGYKLIGMKMVHPTQEQAQRHYKRLSGRSFFKQLVDYFTSGPVVAMSWEGVNVVSGIRRIIGGIGQGDSIREEFSMNILHNVAHTSDSVESGKIETSLWFAPGELMSWGGTDDDWSYET